MHGNDKDVQQQHNVLCLRFWQNTFPTFCIQGPVELCLFSTTFKFAVKCFCKKRLQKRTEISEIPGLNFPSPPFRPLCNPGQECCLFLVLKTVKRSESPASYFTSSKGGKRVLSFLNLPHFSCCSVIFLQPMKYLDMGVSPLSSIPSYCV